MRLIKIVTSIIGYIIYHKTNKYVTTTILAGDLHYTLYHLYRVDKLFLVISVHRLIDKANSLGESVKKRNQWFHNYPYLKEI